MHPAFKHRGKVSCSKHVDDRRRSNILGMQDFDFFPNLITFALILQQFCPSNQICPNLTNFALENIWGTAQALNEQKSFCIKFNYNFRG